MSSKYSDLDKAIKIDVYSRPGRYSTSDLVELERRLAHVANQRLDRLEKAISPVTGERYSVYGAAEKAYYHLEQEGRRRFPEYTRTVTDDLYEPEYQYRQRLIKHINAAQAFLASKSSTVSGQKSIEKKRLAAFQDIGAVTASGQTRKRAISSATNKQFYNFLNSDTFQKLLKVYSSEMIVELYDEAVEKSKADEKDRFEIIAQAFNDFLDDTSKTEKALIQKLDDASNKIYIDKKTGYTSSKKKNRSAKRKKRKKK